MTARLKWHHYLSLNAIYFGLSFMWNSLHPIILPLLLLSYGSEHTKNTRLGMLTFVGYMLAIVVQPIVGGLSDATRHRLGRRRPWILYGAVLSAIFLLILAGATSFAVVAAGYLLLQVSANALMSAANGLIPDLVPAPRRGPASGAKAFLDMVALIVAGAVAGLLMGSAAQRADVNIVLVAVVLTGTVAWTLIGAREESTHGGTAGRMALPRLKDALALREKPRGGYALLLTSRFLLLLSVSSVQVYALYFFRDVHGMAEPAAMVSSLMVFIGIPVTLAVLPAGILSERWGRKGLSLVACGLTAICMVLLLITRSITAIRVLGAFTGLAMGIFISVNWAWVTDLVPAAEAGKYMGIVNLASAGPGAVARLLGPVIDLGNVWREHMGYSVIFLLAAAASLTALAVTLRIPETRGRRADEEAPPRARVLPEGSSTSEVPGS